MSEINGLALEYVRSRVRRREVSAHTGRDQWSTLSTFVRVAGNRRVDQIGEALIERWLTDRSHVQPSTLATQWSQVAGFLDWLVKHHGLRRNPMRDMRPPRRPRLQPITIDPDDSTRLLAVLPDARAHAIVQLELGMGARRVEVSRLRVEDWYRREGIVLLTGKGGHERHVPVPDTAARALDAYLAEHPATSGPLIRSYKRPAQPLTPGAIGHLVTEWMAEAGVKHAPWDGRSGHSLRRTAASEVLDVTGDLRAVQELLGHVNLSSTAHYLRRLEMAKLRDALEARSCLGGPIALAEAA